MTKCIVLGSQDEPQKEKKPIEFISTILVDNRFSNDDNVLRRPSRNPNNWKYIKLIQKNWRGQGMDLMIAHDDPQHNGVIVLGHWNDGVVE